MAEYYGIDVSSNNGTPDWSKVSGVSFVIMRITQRYGIDSKFEHNYEGATEAGLKRGVYRVSYATNAEESKKEAEDVVKTLAGRKLNYPIFLDLEWEEQMKFGKDRLADIIKAFREVVLTNSYKFGIYTNKNWYDTLISDEIKSKCEFWIASVPSTKNDNGTKQERLNPGFGVGWQYSWAGSVPGIKGNVDMDVFYNDFSEGAKVEEAVNSVTAKDAIQVAKGWVGKKEADGSHRAIIDIYNSHKPLARGYKVQYTDQWCDTFISAIYISLSAVDLIGGTECGVEEHVKLFKKAGIWVEDGNATPKEGWLIVFNWDDSTQPNDGYSDHIGIVEKVSGKTITTIEGNYKDSVARRTLQVGHGNIRGYARPKYAAASSGISEIKPEKPVNNSSSVNSVIPSTSHPTLKLNSPEYNEIKTLQTYLNKFGYGLVVDGLFGIKTYLAVRDFQKNHDLFVDGICGPNTWKKLDSLVGSAGKKSVTEIAKEVIAGKWGNQPDREKRLKAAGYNYAEVQNAVNKLLKK